MVEEIPNNHLAYIKPVVNNGIILPVPQLVEFAGFRVAINSSTPEVGSMVPPETDPEKKKEIPNLETIIFSFPSFNPFVFF